MRNCERQEEPRTLREAHAMVMAARPGRHEDRLVWLAWRQSNRRIYQQVSAIDDGHRGFALYWAAYESQKMAELTARIRLTLPAT